MSYVSWGSKIHQKLSSFRANIQPESDFKLKQFDSTTFQLIVVLVQCVLSNFQQQNISKLSKKYQFSNRRISQSRTVDRGAFIQIRTSKNLELQSVFCVLVLPIICDITSNHTKHVLSQRSLLLGLTASLL